MRIRTYSELMRLKSFEERFKYLALNGSVGHSTFGFDRHLNQRFYTSSEWRSKRRDVIVRDNSCDLGLEGREIHRGLCVHHMNPMTRDDLVELNPDTLNPEYLITASHDTHNAIHYGDASLLRRQHVERKPGDTKLW